MSQAADPVPDENTDLSHTWIVAAEVPVTERTAKHANLRGSFLTSEGHRIRALEVYCRECKRMFDDVAGEPCSALINNQHLRGGPIDERKKRKAPQWVETTADYGKPIDRRGVAAYVSGVSRSA